MSIKMREAFKLLSNESALVEKVKDFIELGGFSVNALTSTSRLVFTFLKSPNVINLICDYSGKSPTAIVGPLFARDELNFLSANLFHYINYKDQYRSYPLSYYLDLMLEYRGTIEISDVVIHSIERLDFISKANISYRQYWDKRSEKPKVVKSEIILGGNYEGDRLAEDFELEGIKYYPKIEVYYFDKSPFYLATSRIEAVTILLEKLED